MRFFLRYSLTVFVTIVIVGCGSTVPWQLQSARIYMKDQKDWKKAITFIDSFHVNHTPTEESLWRLGACYEKLRDWENMANFYDSSLVLGSTFEVIITDSRNKLRRRYVSISADHIDEADSLKGADEPDMNLVNAHYDSALAYLDTLITMIPNSQDVYDQAARTAFIAKLYEQAIKYAEREIELEAEGDPVLAIRRILLYSNENLNNLDETFNWAQRLLHIIDPTADSSQAQVYLEATEVLVNVYTMRGNDEAAEKAVSDALQRFPENIDLKRNMGYMFYKKEDYDAALAVLREVLASEPNSMDANLIIGTILVNQEKYGEAIPYLEKALEIEPENLTVMQNLSSAYARNGRTKEGAELYKKLKELEGKSD